MTSLNRVEIIGNIVRNAELTNRNINGVLTPCSKFSVAVNETRANGKDIVTYFDVTLWRERATGLSQWLMKGRQVYVSGHIRLNQYTGSDGPAYTTLQIHDPEVILLGKKPVDQVNSSAPVPVDFDEDELPFG